MKTPYFLPSEVETQQHSLKITTNSNNRITNGLQVIKNIMKDSTTTKDQQAEDTRLMRVIKINNKTMGVNSTITMIRHLVTITKTNNISTVSQSTITKTTHHSLKNKNNSRNLINLKVPLNKPHPTWLLFET